MQQLDNSIKHFMFDMSCYGIKAYTSENSLYVKQFYYPDILKNLLKRKYFENGSLYYCCERFFPDYMGILDSTGFFDGVTDSADWVDDLLIKIEEERIASEINEMDDMLNEAMEIDDTIDKAAEIEKVFDEETKVNEITGKDSQLSFMEFENEVFIPKKTSDGYIIVHSSSNSVERKFYDDKFRLTTKENWIITNTKESDLQETYTYEYFEDSNTVSMQKIELKNSEIKYTYTRNGLISEKTEYDMYKDKPYAVAVNSFKYNDENKIIEQASVKNTYNSTYSKITEKFTKKYVYKYNEMEDIPPDFEYFENNILKMHNKYSVIKGTYTSQIFFDKVFSVKTYYEDEKRVKDVYTQNNQVIREKKYEN